VKPAPFDYVAARSVPETLEHLARAGAEAKVLAGGQSLVPMLNLRLARPALLVDINGAAELDSLRPSDGTLVVGALVRQRMLERWAQGRSPLLTEALRLVGHPAIRTRGTVVGSLVHGDPAAELPALLLACDGAVVARGRAGERVIAARDLYLGPLTTALAPDELATEARFALPGDGAGWEVAEVARRHGDFALVGGVALMWRDPEGRVARSRLAFFGVGGTPVLAESAERALVGYEPTAARVREAARVAADTLSPETDLHATAAYRRRVAAALGERMLAAAARRSATFR
jgi:aerobic carbon-monoxide dehydrogenase medium subunit